MCNIEICIWIQNAQDGITTFTISIQTLDQLKEITRSTSGMEYNGSWHNPRQEKRQIKTNQSKDDQQILPHIRLPIVKDKKYLEIIPGGR